MAFGAELIVPFRDFYFFAIHLLIAALSLNHKYGYGRILNFWKVLAEGGGTFPLVFFPSRLVAWLFNISLHAYLVYRLYLTSL